MELDDEEEDAEVVSSVELDSLSDVVSSTAVSSSEKGPKLKSTEQAVRVSGASAATVKVAICFAILMTVTVTVIWNTRGPVHGFVIAG